MREEGRRKDWMGAKRSDDTTTNDRRASYCHRLIVSLLERYHKRKNYRWRHKIVTVNCAIGGVKTFKYFELFLQCFTGGNVCWKKSICAKMCLLYYLWTDAVCTSCGHVGHLVALESKKHCAEIHPGTLLGIFVKHWTPSSKFLKRRLRARPRNENRIL